MEVTFRKSEFTYLKTLVSQIRSQELTQEMRIPDSMPDIGKVLCCGGQIVVRSKEWQSSSVSISGGVSVWCLYSSEDGGGIQSTETWMPFQETWDFQNSARDGWVYVSPDIRSLDVRCTSARKIMVRCTVSTYGEAMVQEEAAMYIPAGVPSDVELLCKRYPLEIPREIGEKQFQMEDSLPISDGKPAIKQIVTAKTDAVILECRVMTNKLVFRGEAKLDVVYLDEEGKLQFAQWKQPFSQLTDLDKEYDNDSHAWICPVLTGQDVTLAEDGQVQFRCGIAAQYILYDKTVLTTVEDGYSNRRGLQLQREELKIPVRLDLYQDRVDLQTKMNEECNELSDFFCQACVSDVNIQDDSMKLNIAGQFQFICKDENNAVQGLLLKGNKEIELKSDQGNQIRTLISGSGDKSMDRTANGIVLHQTVDVDVEVVCEQLFDVISGLEIGEVEAHNTNGPSIILKKIGSNKLWNVAKECHSTVALIKAANGVDDEEELIDRILLIPVR